MFSTFQGNIACGDGRGLRIIGTELDGRTVARGIVAFCRGRKVRSPQGNMPANGRGGSLKAGFTESATENYTACRVFWQVRVKRCGKSAPRRQ